MKISKDAIKHNANTTDTLDIIDAVIFMESPESENTRQDVDIEIFTKYWLHYDLLSI
jgi:hypothetical protein